MTKEIAQECVEEIVLGQKELILHNDDYNTFDYVIDCLVAVCKHNALQAEQCAYLVHHTGKCTVKKGPAEPLLKMYKELKFLNLTVEIK